MFRCLVGREFAAKELDNNTKVTIPWYSQVYVLLDSMDRAFRLIWNDCRCEITQEDFNLLLANGNLVLR